MRGARYGVEHVKLRSDLLSSHFLVGVVSWQDGLVALPRVREVGGPWWQTLSSDTLWITRGGLKKGFCVCENIRCGGKLMIYG